MKLISMGTCLALQMSNIILSETMAVSKKRIKPGTNVNLLMFAAFVKVFFHDAKTILAARKDINDFYDGKEK